MAAIEALLALRHLVGEQVSIRLLAPDAVFVHRPSSVAPPFGLGGPAPLDLAAFARDRRPAVARDAWRGSMPPAAWPCSRAARPRTTTS